MAEVRFLIAPLIDPAATTSDAWTLEVMPYPGGLATGQGAIFHTGKELTTWLENLSATPAAAVGWTNAVTARTGFAVKSTDAQWNALLSKIPGRT